MAENVAQGKPCNVSSIHYSGAGSDRWGNPCTVANNGNTSMAYTKGNCIHTTENDAFPHWSVNLGQPYAIHKVTIIPRGETVFD